MEVTSTLHSYIKQAMTMIVTSYFDEYLDRQMLNICHSSILAICL